MKLSDLKPLGEVIEDHRRDDPQFQAEWDRLAFARSVAAQVLAYRTERRLSQRALAATLGVTQPQIARLESAEHQPSIETLAKLSQATGLRFRFEVANGSVELLTA